MSLRVYNSLTRAKEPFVPLATGRVGMYVCGVTVYDRSHVGHARSALVFDVIRRYLSFRGDRVHFVKNYTDVDDKIIARAARTGEDWRELTARYVREYEEDMQWLGVEPPTEAPRATGYVPQMQALIGRLLDAGVAYRTDGDVYFEVRRFPGYGRLSGRALDDLRAGARVEVDDRKRDPLDFALWKAAKPGEPWWDSPWGRGRPGWHVECSAMAMGLLGETFDVHGGGLDLVFPHHENEIAQSEAATGKPFARYWLHNGFVNVAAEKMSKSLGNILTIRELRDGTPNHPGGFDPEALRRYLIATHYRAPLDFWEPRIDEHGRALAGIRALVAKAFRLAGEAGIPGAELPWSDIRAASVECMVCERGGDDSAERIASAYAEFAAGMDDDFNTPRALAALHDLATAVGEPEGLEGAGLERWRQGVGVLLALGRVLGLLWRRTDPDEFTAENAEAFQDLLRQREEARRRRDWARADAIREELRSQGVRIEDTPAGPRLRWSRETTGA